MMLVAEVTGQAAVLLFGLRSLIGKPSSPMNP